MDVFNFMPRLVSVFSNWFILGLFIPYTWYSYLDWLEVFNSMPKSVFTISKWYMWGLFISYTWTGFAFPLVKIIPQEYQLYRINNRGQYQQVNIGFRFFAYKIYSKGVTATIIITISVTEEQPRAATIGRHQVSLFCSENPFIHKVHSKEVTTTGIACKICNIGAIADSSNK